MTAQELIPSSFVDLVSGRAADARPGGIDGNSWLRRLPGLLEDTLARWDLRVDGPSRHGECAVVVPVKRPNTEPAVLKVTWPHAEAAHEHLALRAWDGGGAVRLIAAHPAAFALLLERLDPDRDLRTAPVETACTVIGQLIRRLERQPLPQLDTVAQVTERFLIRAEQPAGIPRRFVEQAIGLAGDLLAEGTAHERLIHADLHYENVLGRSDGSWCAIDPKPLSGPLEYAVWPALHNRWDEAVASHDPKWETKLRLGWLCDAAGVEEDRARAWSLVRTVADAFGLLDTFPAADLGPRVTLMKALQPD